MFWEKKLTQWVEEVRSRPTCPHASCFGMDNSMISASFSRRKSRCM